MHQYSSAPILAQTRHSVLARGSINTRSRILTPRGRSSATNARSRTHISVASSGAGLSRASTWRYCRALISSVGDIFGIYWRRLLGVLIWGRLLTGHVPTFDRTGRFRAREIRLSSGFADNIPPFLGIRSSECFEG